MWLVMKGLKGATFCLYTFNTKGHSLLSPVNAVRGIKCCLTWWQTVCHGHSPGSVCLKMFQLSCGLCPCLLVSGVRVRRCLKRASLVPLANREASPSRKTQEFHRWETATTTVSADLCSFCFVYIAALLLIHFSFAPQKLMKTREKKSNNPFVTVVSSVLFFCASLIQPFLSRIVSPWGSSQCLPALEACSQGRNRWSQWTVPVNSWATGARFCSLISVIVTPQSSLKAYRTDCWLKSAGQVRAVWSGTDLYDSEHWLCKHSEGVHHHFPLANTLTFLSLACQA